MNKNIVTEIAKNVLGKLPTEYGLSNHQEGPPYLNIELSPYADAEDPESFGEFLYDSNDLVLYWKNIPSIEDLIRTMVHEYQHYLQSPTWMTRYYNMGYGYSNHPYELSAYKEEENWKIFLDNDK